MIPQTNKLRLNSSYKTFDKPKTPFKNKNFNANNDNNNNYGDEHNNYLNNINKSVDYSTINRDQLQRKASLQSSLEQSPQSQDPFAENSNRYRTTRKQRLKAKEDEAAKPQVPRPNFNVPTICYPGETRVHEETREKNHGFGEFRRSANRSMNRSQNMTTDYRTAIEESPKFREQRIQEALEDHSRDGAEQSRYFTRLEKSNHKQKAIFAEHYKKYIIPNAMMVNAKREMEQQRMLDAKRRMEQLEIEQDNNMYTLKKEYNDYLKNQMAEKLRLKEQAREAKQRLYDHMEYKRKMYEDEVLQTKMEKKREQEELYNILCNQSMYKQLVPAREPNIKPYVDKYETSEPDKIYTLGGVDLQKTGFQKGKSRRQNTYVPPNPIVNPLPDYNIYIRQHISANKHKYAAGGGLSKSVLSSSAAHNMSL